MSMRRVVTSAVRLGMPAEEADGLSASIAARPKLSIIDDDMSQTMIGDSAAMEHVRHLIGAVAETDAKVLILGETGTGKELVARAIHEQSRRIAHPFVPVNMAALPRDLAESLLFGHEKGAFSGADAARKGCCETADKGTLFLDEIGEMDLYLQAKLLRFLQDGTVHRVGSSRPCPVDARVVAATNRSSEELVSDGRLREDLYYRLNVFPIVVPPLRQRREDIPLLAERFLRRVAERTGRGVAEFNSGAMEILQAYDWPGNVRELENLVERLVILARTPCIDADSLPSHLRRPGATSPGIDVPKAPHVDDVPELRRMDRVERTAILDALSHSKGNVVAAARHLGIGQATLYRKIKRYNIDPATLRQAPRTRGAS
jgi:DNA-binding NtrC family response regulator